MIASLSGLHALQIEKAVVRHVDLIALNDVTLNIAQGKWTSIIGPNGAGKSTLLRVCAGLQGDPSCVAIHGDTLHLHWHKWLLLAMW